MSNRELELFLAALGIAALSLWSVKFFRMLREDIADRRQMRAEREFALAKARVELMTKGEELIESLTEEAEAE